ncbi:S41 family peptidase [Cytophagaceae bacterium DM2B3-1]|uniref:S41 family peptidase n=1 Tax=Xanthocytophaga flava TaxID=3048013 RepID=A0ABT7CJ24_9BACT|nr:S41 family peptidase [Xanthocytophaga flavus]MDJ1467649.1 S41 family peptidase [Xanthocytophaga flavus]MDJ1493729.1 S41 family peptidase [Xanthocytophaga flavus]
MIKYVLPLLVLLFIIPPVTSQVVAPHFVQQKFASDTVKKAITELTTELALKHPGFYRYTSKELFDAYIDSTKSTLTDSVSLLEAFLKMKQIVAKVNCLHTGITLSHYYVDYLNQQPNLLPLQVYFSEGKAYVVKNYSDQSSIEVGDEIVSINGRDIPSITRQLFDLIPSDGYNLTLKYRSLYFQFPLWYRLLEATNQFSVVVRQKGIMKSYQVFGKKRDEIAEDGFLKEPAYSKPLDFKVVNDIGVLTIHTFAKTDIKKAGQSFKPYIDKVFKEIQAKDIRNLVVDLRDNTGGSDPYAVYFTRHFFTEPFRYWDRIEVTESIAKQIKGVGLTLFYRKPVQNNKVWLWKKARHVSDFDFYEEQKPVKDNYTGNTYILVNGFSMSSCADVAAILSFNKKAIVVGQETGGGYHGNTSGMMPVSILDRFGFRLSVPLQKYVNHVDSSSPVGRGVLPEYPIATSIEELLKKEDTELAFVLNLIKQQSVSH